MVKEYETGIWKIFTRLPKVGDFYKFKVRGASGEEVMRIDPFAQKLEKALGEAAVVFDENETTKIWREFIFCKRLPK